MSGFNFRTGDAVAEETAKSSGGGGRIKFLNLGKSGDSEIVRLLTPKDEWITVAQHAAVPTGTKPKDFKGNWPSAMTAVCQNDVAFSDGNGNFFPGYGNCPLCSSGLKNSWGKPISKTTPRQWALAAAREIASRDGQGRITGLKDKLVTFESEKEGGEKTVRQILVINGAWKNMFSALAAFTHVYGDVTDRDYKVTRSNEGTDTAYNFVPLDKIDGYEPGGTWPYAEELAKEQISLGDIVAERASADFYAKFFSYGAEGAEGGGVQNVTAPAQEVPGGAVGAVDADALAAMRARISSRAADS